MITSGFQSSPQHATLFTLISQRLLTSRPSPRFYANRKSLFTLSNFTAATLALLDTKANYISAYLNNLLLDIPKKFCIIKQQVLACAVDNASNMIRTVQPLYEEEENDGNKFGEDVCEEPEEVENTEGSITINQLKYHMR